MYQVTAARPERNGQAGYEVHRRTSAGWGFSANRTEMEDAIGEAKRLLGLAGTEAVRVVRDHFDPATQTVRPNTVFRAAAPVAAAAVRPVVLRRSLAASLVLSLVVIGLGTALTWLRS